MVSARTFLLQRQRSEVAPAPVLREKSGGKYVCGSHFPPAEARFATCSHRVNALKKCSRLGRRLELRDGFQFLEGRSERVRQAPHGPRSEFFDLGIEIQIVDTAGQVFRGVELALHEGPVDDQLRGLIREAGPLPRLDLLLHWVKVPLHAVHTDREDVHEAQVFRVLGEDGCEHPTNGQDDE